MKSPSLSPAFERAQPFGLGGNDSDGYYKELRNSLGQDNSKRVEPNEIPWRNGDIQTRTLQMNALADVIKGKVGKSMNSASFALEMIEGVQKVRLVLANS